MDIIGPLQWNQNFVYKAPTCVNKSVMTHKHAFQKKNKNRQKIPGKVWTLNITIIQQLYIKTNKWSVCFM